MLTLSGSAVTASAQYPGRIAKTDKGAPILRSIAVLEWTGAPGKPSASRLVPVSVYDGEQLNDGTIYLTEPAPLALSNGVEYELQTAGKPTGIFDVFAANEVNGTWEGFGVWKPLTTSEAAKASAAFNTSTLYNSQNDADNDQPVLHRKHPKEADSDSNSKGSDSAPASSGAGDAAKLAPTDPDRPTLKRKSGDDSSSGSASGSGGSSASTASVDPDRPTLHRSHHGADSDMQTSSAAPDPDRPRLKRGKPAGLENTEIPQLKGFPPSMQQAVAVSDARNRAEHPWRYSWANPDDEAKMKTAMEAIARTALGLDAPPAPAPAKAKPGAKTVPHKKTSLLATAPPEPAPLADEQFHVFELTYGSAATMVLTASTPLPPTPDPEQTTDSEPPPPVIKRGKPTSSASQPVQPTQAQPKPAPRKFVTLVAQPDLYGGVAVLFKSLTDSAHLDDKPRMRLVDAVDAMADNRGELLFELRGKTQRQFALFRVLRGSAEQLFATVAMPESSRVEALE